METAPRHPIPVQMWQRVSPVPVQMWRRGAESRCRCCSGGRSRPLPIYARTVPLGTRVVHSTHCMRAHTHSAYHTAGAALFCSPTRWCRPDLPLRAHLPQRGDRVRASPQDLRETAGRPSGLHGPDSAVLARSGNPAIVLASPEPAPVVDVAGGEPSSGTDVTGGGPSPVQMLQQ